MSMENRHRIYLDHAATTPLCPEARQAMLQCMEDVGGNPSGIYASARAARRCLENARAETARLLGAAAEEIYFTSGGSESDNWALKGLAFSAGAGSHLITTAIEHPAVLNTCRFLERLGHPVTYVQPDHDGVIDPEKVKEALRPNTALVSVMWANNEIGTIEPVADIGRIAREAGVPMHVDAVQAVGDLPIDLRPAPLDLLSLSAHKFYGPKGIGILYIRKGIRIEPLIHGGEQERGLRASTENVAGAVGLAAALDVAVRARDAEARRQALLRDRLLTLLRESVPGLIVNGSLASRLSGNLHLTIPGVRDQSLIPLLDLNGVEASAGSACTAGSYVESHVLKAIGTPPELLGGSLRLTLGRDTQADDIEEAALRIAETVRALRGNTHV